MHAYEHVSKRVYDVRDWHLDLSERSHIANESTPTYYWTREFKPKKLMQVMQSLCAATYFESRVSIQTDFYCNFFLVKNGPFKYVEKCFIPHMSIFTQLRH